MRGVRRKGLAQHVVRVRLVGQVQFVLNHESQVIGENFLERVDVERVAGFDSHQRGVGLALESEDESEDHPQHHHQTQNPENDDLLLLGGIGLVVAESLLLLALERLVGTLGFFHYYNYYQSKGR